MDSVYASLPVGAALNLALLFDQADTNNHNLPLIGAAERKRDVRGLFQGNIFFGRTVMWNRVAIISSVSIANERD